jgi:hypothetical protein
MVEERSGSSSATATRDLELDRTKNVSSFDSSEAVVEAVVEAEAGAVPAREGGNPFANDHDDDDDDEGDETAGASDRDEEEYDDDDDYFEERRRDSYLEDEIDAALDKELDQQMEAMWDEYSNDVHAEIQSELDRALQEQLDEHLKETYSLVERQLAEDLDRQMRDDFVYEYSSRYDRKEQEPSSTRQFIQRFPVESSSVESINASIQQVIKRHRPTLER